MKEYSAFLKLQHYWNLTIGLFSVISRTFIGRVLPLCRDAVSVFCCSIKLGHQSFLNVKTVLFQTIQFSISTKFSLYIQLNVRTVLFLTSQFSISTQFSYLWTIDKTLLSATTPGQSGPEAMPMKGYTAFLKALALLKPHHLIVLCHIQDNCLGVLPLSRDAVSVFYYPSQLSTLFENKFHGTKTQ